MWEQYVILSEYMYVYMYMHESDYWVSDYFGARILGCSIGGCVHMAE